MAFTKVVGAGIHTLSNVHSHNLNSSGIITATKFVGPITGAGGDFNAGIVTATSLDVNGNGDISGNLVLGGNLTVNGTTTTLDTVLTEVDKLEVAANNSTVGVAITQSGSGDILNLYDGSTEVFSVADGGDVGIARSIFHLGDTNTHIGFANNDTIRLQVYSSQVNYIQLDDSKTVFMRPIMVGDYVSHSGISEIGIKFFNAGGGNNSTNVGLGAEDNGTSGGTNHKTFTVYRQGSSVNRVNIDNSGNLNALQGLTVAGISTFNSQVEVNKTSGTALIKLQNTNGTSQLDIRHTNGYGAVHYVHQGTEKWRVGQTAQSDHFSVYQSSGVSDGLPYRLFIQNNGEVGINTSDPADTLHLLKNNANHGIRLQRAGTNPGTAYVQVHSNGVLSLQGGNNIHYVSGGSQQHVWYRASTEIARFDTSGRLGIGTVPSNYNLEIQGTGQQTILVGSQNANGALLVLDGDSNGDGAGGDYSYIAHDSSGDMLIATDNPNGNSDIVFRAGADDEKVRIKEDGKVGIGTDTPNGDLQIRAGQNASFRVLADTSTSGLFVGNYGSGDGYRSLSLLGSDIRLHTITAGALSGAQERVHIEPDGDVVIKTNDVALSGAGTLRINSGSTAGALNLDGGASNHGGEINLLGGSNGGRILFRTGQGAGQQTEKMRLNENGSLRIGDAATVMSYAAHSEGDDLVIGGSGWRGMTIYGEGGGGVIQFADNGDNRIGQILYNHADNSMDFRTNGNVTRLSLNADGSSYNTSNSSGTTTHQFYNSNSGSGADTRLMVKTYANAGADPFIKFDSGGSNHVVGQLYAGTTNNKLVLGVGESPSGGVSGIHIAGDGVTQVTNHIYMTKSSDPRIYSGSNVGLNIDGMALYLNRYVNSTIAMGRGGGSVEVSNTTSGNDSQLNVYKTTGSNSDKAILRVGYDSSNCYAISRTRNSSSIQVDANQSDAIVHHTAGGDDTMLLTNRNSVHIAKLAPMVIQHAHIQSNASWGGSRPYKFVMRFSTGNFSATYHVARMISQHDWGFADWEAKVLRDYYSPDTGDGARTRYTGYYASHTETVVTYNMRSNSPDIYGDGRRLSLNSNLGPSGAHKIHESANGGYYKDAYATDYYINLGNYSGVLIEVTINNPGGWLRDQATSITTVYPAAFGASASQTDANNWNYGRGIWFNVRPGVLDTSWWGYSSNFGQQTLPTS